MSKVKQIGGDGISGVIQIRYYLDGTALVLISGSGSFKTTAKKANVFYKKYYKGAA